MPRVKSGPVTSRRRKKILKLAKGYRGARSRAFKVAKEAVINAHKDAYKDRRLRRRDFRSLWIVRINAAARAEGMTYGRFIEGLAKADVKLDRKILAGLAVSEPGAFTKLVELAKKSLGKTAA